MSASSTARAPLLRRVLYAARSRLLDPTRSWPRSTIGTLDLELADGSMSGVRIGARLAELRPFGPASGCARDGRQSLDLHYGARGLVVGLWEGEVVHWRLVLDPAHWFAPVAFDPAEARIRVPGAPAASLRPGTTERDLIAWFGSPAEPPGTSEAGRLTTFAVGACILDCFADPQSGRVLDVEVAERAS